MTLGEKITAARKAAGLSQEEFGAAVGVSRQAVSKWELDQAAPDAAYVAAISQRFGVSCDELLKGEKGCCGALERVAERRSRFRMGALLLGLGLLGLLWQYFDIRVGSHFYTLYWTGEMGIFGSDPAYWYQKWLFLAFALTAAGGLWLCVRAAFPKRDAGRGEKGRQ